MCISACVPTSEEVTTLKQGSYKLQKRGGFVGSTGSETQVKRNSYYVVKEALFVQSVSRTNAYHYRGYFASPCIS